MTASTGSVPGRIFMSYRRDETAYPAAWLFESLASHFGRDQIFKDIDSIEPGVDFAEEIFRAVAACKVLLAIIGPAWLTMTDEHGRRRLDDPDDFVRLEIEAALARGIRVIPVLVDRTRMPRDDELPEGLAKLVRLQALELSPNRFDRDVERLLRVLERAVAQAHEQSRDEDEHASAAERQEEQLRDKVREQEATRDMGSVVIHDQPAPPLLADRPVSTAREQLFHPSDLEPTSTDEGVDDEFDPILYGMPAVRDEQGNFVYPEGFDGEKGEWLPGFEKQHDEFERQYAEARARFEAHRREPQGARPPIEASPRPAPKCVHTLIDDGGGVGCELPAGHAGVHKSGDIEWPDR